MKASLTPLRYVLSTVEPINTKLFSDLEVLAEMVTKAPTRVAIVEPCLGEPKDFEGGGILFWTISHWLIARPDSLMGWNPGVQGAVRERGASWVGDLWKRLFCPVVHNDFKTTTYLSLFCQIVHKIISKPLLMFILSGSTHNDFKTTICAYFVRWYKK